jgi:hypothetical protein
VWNLKWIWKWILKWNSTLCLNRNVTYLVN